HPERPETMDFSGLPQGCRLQARAPRLILNRPFTSSGKTFAETRRAPMFAMQYVQPPVALLREISAVPNEDISLDVYCSGQCLLRNFFWLRLRLLAALIRHMRPQPGRCLDFGGGSGVFA